MTENDIKTLTEVALSTVNPMEFLYDGWTLEQLRCDVPPSPEILDAIESVGPEVWEKYVLRSESIRN